MLLPTKNPDGNSSDDRRLRGHAGGGADLSHVGGDAYGTRLGKWTEAWTVKELKDWIHTVNCTKIPNVTKPVEMERKYDMALSKIRLHKKYAADLNLTAFLVTGAGAVLLIAGIAGRWSSTNPSSPSRRSDDSLSALE